MCVRRVKGLILAAGAAGDELSLIAGTPAPQTIAVGNRPLVEHAIGALHAAGIREIAVVVSPATATAVREAVAASGHGSIAWVEHGGPATPAASVAAASEFLAGAPFAVHAGDGILLHPLDGLVDELLRGPVDALLLVRMEAAAAIPAEGPALRLVAGQAATPPQEEELAVAHIFGPSAPAIARRLADAPPSRQTFAALAAEVVAAGGTLETRGVPGGWRYGGDVDGILEANRLVLDKLAPEPIAADVTRARIEGRVAIHETAVLERATVRGPAVIGPGAVLADTFVGPYSSIGRRVRLEGTEIEHSIVLPNATIRHPGTRLEGSFVGPDAIVSRDFTLPSSLRVRVGRRNEVWLA